MVDDYSTVETYYVRNDILNNISSIEEYLEIDDNYGHKVRIARRDFDSMERLKSLICQEMHLLHNVQYNPANLRLIHPSRMEIVEIGQTEGIVNIKLVVVPVVCNNRH